MKSFAFMHPIWFVLSVHLMKNRNPLLRALLPNPHCPTKATLWAPNDISSLFYHGFPSSPWPRCSDLTGLAYLRRPQPANVGRTQKATFATKWTDVVNLRFYSTPNKYVHIKLNQHDNKLKSFIHFSTSHVF